ncbi:MAG TPA: YbdD/YjiX family protein [Gemmatimonadaceae bacterium]
MTTSRIVETTRERIERAACILRRVIGVPDYDRYLAHVHAHHPDAIPMTRDEFLQHRMLEKYTKPGGRCC